MANFETLLAFHQVFDFCQLVDITRCDRANWQVKLFLVPISLFLVSLLSPENKLPFIYFDF